MGKFDLQGKVEIHGIGSEYDKHFCWVKNDARDQFDNALKFEVKDEAVKSPSCNYLGKLLSAVRTLAW